MKRDNQIRRIPRSRQELLPLAGAFIAFLMFVGTAILTAYSW